MEKLKHSAGPFSSKPGIFLSILIKGLIIFTVAVFFTVPAGCRSMKQSIPEKIENGTDTSAESSVSAETTAVPTSAEDNPVKNPQEPDITTTTGDTVADTESSGNNFGVSDVEKQRDFFKRGVEAFQEDNYVIAEYYFNQIKDTYLILADHILYYNAKSLLLQEKFKLAEQNYINLKNNFPDSIFRQKAVLEYADLFFIRQQYLNAETGYEEFLTLFSLSELAPYCRFQLAVCQERNNKFSSAFENYKKIWLENPDSEYAEKSWAALLSLAEKKITETFTPSNNDLYGRGEKFFDIYWYENAISEFKKILDSAASASLDQSLEAKTIFKLGMCYFNLRDYGSSREYLLSGLKKYPSGSYADDSLYFLGRAETNLDNESEALRYYDELLAKFPQSNYADDGLYRTGRIYFFKDDLETAAKYFQRIVSEYPAGDKIPDAFWELGWIQYKTDDFSNAVDTFSKMADRFKGGQLEEKALFWKAKCHEKLNQEDTAVESLKKIISLGSYSYYTFAAQKTLEEKGINETLPAIDTSVYPDNPQIAELLPEIYDDIFNSKKENSTTAADTQSDAAGQTVATESTSDNPQSQELQNQSSQPVEFTHTDKAKELLIIEFHDSADAEIKAASNEFGRDNFGILQISTLYLMAKDYINSQKIISEHYSKMKSSLSSPYKDYFYYLIYPYGFREYVDKYSAVNGVDPLFVLAVIREESRFNPEAGSYAGALGLMQIIPSTGKGIAGMLGIKNFSTEMLLDPQTSIKMGSYYLSKQLESFSQNKYYACGAYNGGPGAMNKWISLYGDRDIDEFIEYVPYDETRNYIKKVMASYFFYQMLYR